MVERKSIILCQLMAAGIYLCMLGMPSTAFSASLTLSPVEDSYLSEADPTANFGTSSPLIVRKQAMNSFRAVVRFDLSSVPNNVTVDSAVISFFVTTTANSSVNIHRITSSWNEPTVNWNNTAVNFDATADGSFIPNLLNVFESTNITSLVQEWVSGAADNYGLMLIAAGEGDESRYSSREAISSLQPKLEITTTDSTPTPTPTHTSTPTPTPIPTATPTNTATPSPTATPSYTFTPTPIPTATPTNTATPSPTQPDVQATPTKRPNPKLEAKRLDLNKDSFVNSLDLILHLQDQRSNDFRSDFNLDEKVNFQDLFLFGFYWNEPIHQDQ